MTYRFLPHTADVRLEVRASTLEALLTEAAAGLRALLAGDRPVSALERRAVAVAGAEPAELLFECLREMLAQFHADAFLPAAFTVTELQAAPGGPLAAAGLLAGETFDPARHEHRPEVKAVTRHGLTVQLTDDGWHAEVVLDV